MSVKRKARKARKKDKQQTSICAIPWFTGVWSNNDSKIKTKSLPKIKHHPTINTKENLITKETVMDLMNEYDKLRRINDIKLNKVRALINNTNLDVVNNKIKSKLERYFESCIIDIKESNKTMNKIVNILPHYANKNTMEDITPFTVDNSLNNGFPLITDNNIHNQTIQQGFNYINTVHTNTLNMPQVVMSNRDPKMDATKMTRVTSADAIKDERVRRLSSPSGWSKKILDIHDDSHSTDDASFHESDNNDDNDIESDNSIDINPLSKHDLILANDESEISQLSSAIKHQRSDTMIIKVDNPEPESKTNNHAMNKLTALQSQSIGYDDSSDNDVQKSSYLKPNLSRDSNESNERTPKSKKDKKDLRHGSLLRAGSKASWSLNELENESYDIKRQMQSIIEQHSK